MGSSHVCLCLFTKLDEDDILERKYALRETTRCNYPELYPPSCTFIQPTGSFLMRGPNSLFRELKSTLFQKTTLHTVQNRTQSAFDMYNPICRQHSLYTLYTPQAILAISQNITYIIHRLEGSNGPQDISLITLFHYHNHEQLFAPPPLNRVIPSSEVSLVYGKIE